MYYKTEIKAGDTIEVIKSYSKREGCTGRRLARQRATPEEIEKTNQRNAEAKLRRLINANFGLGDYHLVLTYKKNLRPDPKGAKDHVSKFIRRLRNEYRKIDKELKFIHVTEYKNTAIHHHLIINGVEAVNINRLIRSLWPWGSPHFTPLDDTGQYKELAAYLIKETSKTFRENDGGHKQRYSCSRNLKKPIVKTTIVNSSCWNENPKPIKGFYLDKSSIENGYCGWSGTKFLKYTMVRLRKEKRKRRGGR